MSAILPNRTLFVAQFLVTCVLGLLIVPCAKAAPTSFAQELKKTPLLLWPYCRPAVTNELAQIRQQGGPEGDLKSAKGFERPVYVADQLSRIDTAWIEKEIRFVQEMGPRREVYAKEVCEVLLQEVQEWDARCERLNKALVELAPSLSQDERVHSPFTADCFKETSRQALWNKLLSLTAIVDDQTFERARSVAGRFGDAKKKLADYAALVSPLPNPDTETRPIRVSAIPEAEQTAIKAFLARYYEIAVEDPAKLKPLFDNPEYFSKQTAHVQKGQVKQVDLSKSTFEFTRVTDHLTIVKAEGLSVRVNQAGTDVVQQGRAELVLRKEDSHFTIVEIIH